MSIASQCITTFAICLKLSLSNGDIIRLTDHDDDIMINSDIYVASNSFFYSNIESNSSLSVDNLEIQGAMSADCVNEVDIMAGKYDDAQIEIFRVNYLDPLNDQIILKLGTISEIKILDNQFVAEVHGMSMGAEKQITDSFSPSCRAKFCDNLCKLENENFTEVGCVTNLVVNRRRFVDTSLQRSKNYYKYGLVTFLSGENKSFAVEIKRSDFNEVELLFLTPYEIKPGDRYQISVGCDKSFMTCDKIYNNTINFRGEPHVPGVQKLFQSVREEL